MGNRIRMRNSPDMLLGMILQFEFLSKYVDEALGYFVRVQHTSIECQYAVLILQNTPYCLEEQIRCLDYRDQYTVLSRRVDTSYPTGGYGVSVDLSEQDT
ncbi:hypothetical protein Tco_0512267 [Tanacetum coccineum]